MKKLLILLLFPLMMFAQDTTLIGDVDCSGGVNSEDASLILQFITNVIEELPCQENMSGLTPEQLQEIINMMNEQLSINYSNGMSSGNPIMVSGQSEESFTISSAFEYCANLEEGGYSDWVLPNLEQLTYAVGGGCDLPGERTVDYLVTASFANDDNYSVIIVRLSDTYAIRSQHDYDSHPCRCVRFGEGETSEISSGSSNSSGSSILGDSEQTITMIGPRFTNADFPDFPNYNTELYEDENNYLRYVDAIVFCSQLQYDGYDDWFLPNYFQIQNYISQQQNLIFLNGFDDASGTFWTKLNIHDLDLYNSTVQGLVVSISGDSYPYQNLTNTMRALYSAGINDNGHFCFCVR